MSCRGCIYRASTHEGYQCDYLLITGHSRGCPIEGCTKKETKGTAQRRKPRPVTLPGSLPPDKRGNRTAHRTRGDRPGQPLKLNEAAAMELYLKGLSDAKIAAELGDITPNGIAAWRKRKGIPSQRRRKKEAI